ncbi:MAG: MFS transporter [Chlamydiae bacterium]|nr:MFS transporter [Chlamydiota bacterium]
MSLSFKDKNRCLKVLKVLYLSRFSDEKMSKMVKQNKGGTFYLSNAGHDLIGTLCALSLIPKKDWAYPYYRDRAFVIGLEAPLIDIFGSFLARDVHHHGGGRMMPDHFSHKELKIPCQSSCVGSQFLQATGLALGVKEKNEVVYVSGGDGSTSQGDFHEALNFSCIKNLPIIFVIQDNAYAISTTLDEQTAGKSIAKVCQGFENLLILEIDGTDYLETSTAAQKAVEKARSNNGPSLIVAKVPRLGAHSNSDDPSKYKDATIIESEKKRDPLPKFEAWLLSEKILTSIEIANVKQEAQKEVEEASIEAEQIPFPSTENYPTKIFKEFDVIKSEPKLGESIVMMDAINHAIDEEMQRDPGVLVFGEDVAKGKGGVFGITKNLTQKYGSQRCFNTPLAESCIIGVAIGLSTDGFHKPIAEIQFADYMWPAMNQLANELPSIFYRSNGEWNCPVVVRMTYGGYIQGGPYHSQSIEAHFCSIPGIKVVIPSNAQDAKRLLKTAIRDPSPVIFLEHKALYRQRFFAAREEPSSDELEEFGKAKIIAEGKDATIVCWGLMAVFVFEIAEKLKKENIFIEVLDLRTLVPLDKNSILESVKKTGKLLIVHEAPKTCGFGAELASQVMEEAFSYLDAPVVRIGAKDCMVPYAKNLEDATLPQKEEIEKAIRKLVSY